MVDVDVADFLRQVRGKPEELLPLGTDEYCSPRHQTLFAPS
jgi:hypothetical protein